MSEHKNKTGDVNPYQDSSRKTSSKHHGHRRLKSTGSSFGNDVEVIPKANLKYSVKNSGNEMSVKGGGAGMF